MQRKVVTRRIDDLEVTCQQSPFERAFPLASRAAVLFSVKHDDVETSTMLALAAFQRDPALLGDLLAGTHVVYEEKGKLATESLSSAEGRNRVFTGRIGTAIKVALFAAEVEFRDFFGGVFAEKGEGAEANSPAE